MVNLKSLIGKLNPVCRQALEGAAGLCLSRTHYHIEVEHWLIKILERTNTDLDAIATKFDIDLSRVAGDLTKSIDRFRTGNGRSPDLNHELVEVTRDAWVTASVDMGEPLVRSGHLVLAALGHAAVRRALVGSVPALGDIDADALRRGFLAITADSEEAGAGTLTATPAQGDAPAGAAVRGDSALGQFTQDLTAQARAGEIDPVLGRDNEIRQLIDILCRRRQNNPILTGEAGVGKTAVVEGFARRIAAGDVPDALKSVSLRSLDLALLQAGAGVKGEFENRLKGVIEEVNASPTPIIMFIDEAHNLIGAGGQSGQGDAANLLKPALARGQLRTIAATTWAEYKKYFERDAALARRFQVVVVDEPDEDVAVRMLRGLTDTLESHHNVRILDEAIQEAVHLSKRYITGRQLPDKGVSLLDTTCARVSLTQSSRPAQIEDTERQLEAIDEERGIVQRQGLTDEELGSRVADLDARQAEAEVHLAELNDKWNRESELVGKIRELYAKLGGPGAAADDAAPDGVSPAAGEESEAEGDSEGAAEGAAEKPDTPSEAAPAALTDEERSAVVAELSTLREQLEGVAGETPLVHPCCDGAAIAETVANWTGIPVGRMRADEIETLMRLEQRLEESVVGQSHAMKQIAETIRTGRAKLTDPSRPVGVFMLAGTSGVGKTETALTLANLLYGGDQNLTVINMSEFKEEHKVSLLMGSPPGYVGYGEGGVLTEAVRRKPYSVVLLDEVEKAHPGVQDVFYQVFDKGHMKDGEGRDINFRNTIIIMTSNAGTDMVKQLCSDPDTMPDPEGFVEALQPKLLESFKPAFLGRTTVIPYYPLSPEIMGSIVRLKLGKIARRVAQNYNAEFTYTDAVVETIVSRCTEVDSGARNVDKILNRTLLPELSAEFLDRIGKAEPVSRVAIEMGEGDVFQYAFS